MYSGRAWADTLGMSTVVGIGRNVGDEPMSAERWQAFREEVEYAVNFWAGPVVAVTEGVGLYEGKTEDCAIYMGERTPEDGALGAFRIRLGYIAAQFDQEAIALMVAPVEFVGPVSAKPVA